MARPLRALEAGAFYHVWDNGNTGRTLFPGGTSRHMFCVFLTRALERYEAECHAWCVMRSHFHLLIRTREANLDRFMQFLNSRVASWSNWDRGEVGHLFRGRYSSRLVASDADVLGVARYIDLNPVRAGLVTFPDDWVWSSLRGFVDPIGRRPFHETRFVLGLLDIDPLLARRKYRAFVRDGLETDSALRDGLVGAAHGV